MISILCDTREQRPYRFEGYVRPAVHVVPATLPVGDYSLPGFEDRVSIERKSLDDLIGCLMNGNRERFERELQKAQHYELFSVMVEASLQDVLDHKYRSAMTPKAAIQSIVAFQVRYQTPFMWAGNREGAEYLTFSLLEKHLAEIRKRYERSIEHQKSSVEVGHNDTITLTKVSQDIRLI